MNEYYLWATILLCVLMVAMSVHVLNNKGFNRQQKGWFIATFMAITFCALAEYSLHCGYYDPKFKVILTILTVLQFSIAPVFAMLFAGALGLKYQKRIAIAFFSICFLTNFICAFSSAIFKFTPTGYKRGDAFLIYEISYFGSLVYIIGSLIVVGRKFRNRDTFTIAMVLVVLATGIIPMSIRQLHVAYIAVGMAACLCYVFYNDLVQQDTKIELLNKQKKINDMQVQIIARLSNLIESRDLETGEHVARTREYVKLLATDLMNEGYYTDIIDNHYIDLLYTLAPMHDVGKILISDKILRKPGKLTPEEYEEIKMHALNGGVVVKQILHDIADEEYVQFAMDIATGHHERWDGTGYPHHLKGEEIPLNARIMAIADVFDALVSKRCYKDAMPVEKAFEVMKEESGTHFDPILIEVFLKHKDKYIDIHINNE